MSTKTERKLQDQLNKVRKHLPAAQRIWNLDRIAMEMEAEADTLEEAGDQNQDPDGLRADALYLRRLEYDLITLREAIGQTVRGGNNRKYDPSQWPRGPRP